IKEPSDGVKVGQLVKVHVLSADAKTKRIALSMKTPGAKGAKPAASAKKPAPPPKQTTMEDKLAVLADRWKRR
ncbi:MAG: hypothetical protein WBY44_30285, partial [Bryobacteraceae bacterium]